MSDKKFEQQSHSKEPKRRSKESHPSSMKSQKTSNISIPPTHKKYQKDKSLINKARNKPNSNSGTNSSLTTAKHNQTREFPPSLAENNLDLEEPHSLPSVLPSSTHFKDSTPTNRYKSQRGSQQHKKTTKSKVGYHHHHQQQQEDLLVSSPSSSSSSSHKNFSQTSPLDSINETNNQQTYRKHKSPPSNPNNQLRAGNSSDVTKSSQKTQLHECVDMTTTRPDNSNQRNVTTTTTTTTTTTSLSKTTTSPMWVKSVPIDLFYKIGREIGRGGFSVVKEAFTLESGEKRAVKIINKSRVFDFENSEKQRRALEKLWREIDIMRCVNHKNVLKLFDVFDSEEFIYIVTEFVSGGELFDQIVETGGLPESRAAPIIKQIVSAVRHLHSLNIVHRDVKPENILLTDDEHTQVKLCDFGLANILYENTLLETACGSAEYVAPEVLQCKPYDNAVDLWSIGVTTYIVLSSNFPFYAKSDHQLFEKIIRVEYDFNGDEWEDVSEEAKDFIRRLLVADPKQRMTTEQCLRHPWLAKVPDV